MPELQRQFALARASAGVGAHAPTPVGYAVAMPRGISLRARNAVTLLKLQVRPRLAVDHAALARVLGVATVADSPRALVSGDPAVFWTAPCEWLIAGTRIDAAACRDAIRRLLDPELHVLADQSSGLCILELAGERSRELMAAACAVDMAAPESAAGHYLLTRLHSLPVLIHRTGAPAFEIYVERSVARFLHDWFAMLAAFPGATLPSTPGVRA